MIKISNLTIKARLGIILSVLITGFSLFGVATLTAMNTFNVNGSIYHRIVHDKDLVADILPPPEFIIESYLVMLQLNQTHEANEIRSLTSEFQKLKANYQTRYDYWQKHTQKLDSESALLFDKSYQAAMAFYTEAQEQFIPNVQIGNLEATLNSLVKMQVSYQQHKLAIEDTVNFVTRQYKQEEAEVQNLIEQNNIRLLSIFVFSIGTACFLTFMISRSIIRELGGELCEAIELSKDIAQGDFHSVSLKDGYPDSLMSHMKKMQFQLLDRKVAANNLRDEIMRVKVALDNVNTGVMIADNNLEIVYANNSVIKTLSKNESAIHSQLPNFNSQNLIGAVIDDFHQNPAHQRDMLKSLTSEYKASMMIGGRHMIVIANPVIDENGVRLGTVAEWYDRTAEVMVEKEVADIVVAAGEGNFTKRLNLADKEGILKDLGSGINQLMHTNETSLSEIAHVLQALSIGDLTQKITNDYFGTFGQLKYDANLTVEKITEIVHQIQIASNSINSGAQEIAAGNNDLSHRTEDQAASLEKTAASMMQITHTVQQNAENAKYANQLTENARTIAEKGRAVVGEVVKTMNSINESSRKVVEIISVIDNIAFQTNILALNAAVEAARAGDQGRGFAVVATEVRNLAQRAAAAASEIQMLISDSVGKVDDGSLLVAEAGKTMQEIVTAVQGVTTVMAEITSASVEQSAGIAQVNDAIAQMDNVTQQNAALVEEAAASAELLEDQAQQLSVTVSTFKT